MTVVALRRAEEVSMVSILEDAVERAVSGKMRAFVMVEIGQDGVKVSDVFNDIRDSTLMLAMVGALEHQKFALLKSLGE